MKSTFRGYPAGTVLYQPVVAVFRIDGTERGRMITDFRLIVTDGDHNPGFVLVHSMISPPKAKQ